jgi:hypothetical protein
MLTQRAVCECAWNTILWHGAAGAEAAAAEKVAELRACGAIQGAEMWESVKALIPQMIADPTIWDDLPE